MAFQLPRLTTDIDCEPIGYPGLVVTFWLNPDAQDWEPPWGELRQLRQFTDEAEQEEEWVRFEKERVRFEEERKRILAERPWETLFHYGLGRIIESVEFPASMTDTDDVQVWGILDGKALFGLMNEPGFDQAIIIWSQSQYQDQRAARLEAEAKN